jgi:hypothetical protein
MAHKNERIDAKRLYIEEKFDISEISKRINIPEATIYRWKADDLKAGCDWDKNREEIAMTSFSAAKQMLAAVVSRMTAMVDEIKTDHKVNPSEVYAIRQLILSAKALQKEVDNLGNILLATQEFTDFLAESNYDLLKQLEPYIIEFGSTMSKKYGKRR